MEKKLAIPRIDFADGEFLSFESSDGILLIYINTWEEKILKLVFSNFIQFSYKLGSVVSEMYEISNGSNLQQEALSNYYVKVPKNHPFKLFQIEDIDDLPFLQVIAESVAVIDEV